MDANDGCVSSKTTVRNDADVMGPPSSLAFDEVMNEENGSQPATQPLSDSQGSEIEEQSSMSQDDLKPWGILYAFRPNWQSIELYSDITSVGRSTSNNHAITEREAGKIFVGISKIHFIIRKTRDGIKIEDKSSNGTSVNGIVIGKNKQKPIDHNSLITIAKSKVYVFMFNRSSYMHEYPIELRRKYVVSRELGTGACGTVKLGFHVDSDKHRYPVAIKIINKRMINSSSGRNDVVMNEAKILRAVNHPSIICMEDVIETDSHLYIILELAVGGELFDKIIQKTKFNEKEARIHFYQIVSGIKYLHSRKIAHRDLKPENILLCSDDDTKPVIKITDMGLSKLVGVDTVCKTFCGTPQYLAPEVLISRVRPNGTYDFKVDMWSLGVILYILLSGCPPFNPDRLDKTLVKQICDGDYSFPSSKWSSISPNAIDLVKQLMKVDAKERLSAEQALIHPWLNDEETISRVSELWKGQQLLLTPDQLDHVDGERTATKRSHDDVENQEPSNCKRMRVNVNGDVPIESDRQNGTSGRN